jgi:glycosyltransferase involved in cell wall biosynthesis
MHKKNFVTIFARLKNVDILKMPGMVCYYISKLSNKEFNCTLVTLSNDDYSYHDAFKEFYNLKILGTDKKNGRGNSPVIEYLKTNSKKIDILNLYHLDFETLKYAGIYKKFNPNGKLLLELDADERIKEFFEPAQRKGLLRFTNKIRPFKSHILRSLVKKSDYIAVESEKIYKYLLDNNNKTLSHKLFLNPYGINNEELTKYINPQIKKENIAVTVGRIGTFQKNNEMLMEAIESMDNTGDWKFYFIGPIEKDFQKFITEYFEKNPKLKDIVIFTGEINDRKKLSEYIQKAKVFCLTSRYESYGIVLTEAAYYNCYIISTDTGSAVEITENMVKGKIINNKQQLVDALNRAVVNKIDFENIEKEGKLNYIKENIWEKTVLNLIEKIK